MLFCQLIAGTLGLLREPEDVNVHEYQAATFYCSYGSHTTVKIEWEKENGMLPNAFRLNVFQSPFRPHAESNIFIVRNDYLSTL